jgi:hypothetical protein
MLIFNRIVTTAMAIVFAIPTITTKVTADTRPIWLAVTRPVFLQALEPLAQKRRDDGFNVIVSTQPVDQAMATLPTPPEFMVIIGDHQTGGQQHSWCVPTRSQKLYQFEKNQRPEYASDALWADLDDDLIPDFPIGRIPVRTPDQLKIVVNKILDFEDKPLTPDDLSLLVWAGSPDFNPILDNLVINLGVNLTQQNAPEWLRLWAIVAHPLNPLCGWPPDHAGLFNRQLKKGGALAVLMGHGTANYFYSMKHDRQHIAYSATKLNHFTFYDNYQATLNDLAQGPPAPVTVIIACGCGDFTGPNNCLAESLLLLPAGPVALIAATTESHPLTNAYTALALLQALHGQQKHLGKIWLNAQREMMKTHDFLLEQLLSHFGSMLEEKLDIDMLRRDQFLMYNLLGDPAVCLPLPDPLTVTSEYRHDTWCWKVEKPKNASRLYLAFRTKNLLLNGSPGSPDSLLGPPDPERASLLFHKTNDTFDFEPLHQLGPLESWNGQINKEGDLRLVAVGNGRIYAATVNLSLPGKLKKLKGR